MSKETSHHAPAFVTEEHKKIMKSALADVHRQFREKGLHGVKASMVLEAASPADCSNGHLCFDGVKWNCQPAPCS